MKTTLPDGTVRFVVDDTDLDDEILPSNSGKLLIPHLVVALVVGAALVFGVASLFCI